MEKPILKAEYSMFKTLLLIFSMLYTVITKTIYINLQLKRLLLKIPSIEDDITCKFTKKLQ
jgi:hypothetical protein